MRHTHYTRGTSGDRSATEKAKLPGRVKTMNSMSQAERDEMRRLYGGPARRAQPATAPAGSASPRRE